MHHSMISKLLFLCKCFNNFLRGLYQLNQDPISGYRIRVIALGMNEHNIVTGGTGTNTSSVNLTPFSCIQSTALFKSSTHKPTWFKGGTCTWVIMN
jgi:hypothetical protein